MESKLFLKFLLVAFSINLALAGIEDFVKEHFPFSFGLCKYPKLNGYFQPEKVIEDNYGYELITVFFIDTWIVSRSYNSPFQTDTKCLTIKSELSDSGEIKLFFNIHDPTKKISDTVIGQTYTKYVKFSREIFPVSYINTAGKGSLSMAFSIIDTDYENWAVVYACEQYLGYKHEMAWILTRNGEEIQIPAIEKSVNEVGLKKKDFNGHKNDLCQQQSRHTEL